MYELHHLKGNTYYIDGPTNLGVYKLNDTDCVLIDSGTSKEGPIIETILRRHGLKLKYLINTHCHVDHSGSNLYLKKITGCKIIASRVERAFFTDSQLDLSFMYGGYPLEEYNSYLLHVDENKDTCSLENMPRDLRYFDLPGHHHGMIGVRTSDGVYFVADTICTKELIDKQHIMLVYDVEGYFNSLDLVKSFHGNIIVPSHCPVTTDIKDLAQYNKDKMYEIINLIKSLLKENDYTAEELVSKIFDQYKLKITYNKHLLINSTIKSYLSYLANRKEISHFFKDNKLYFTNK